MHLLLLLKCNFVVGRMFPEAGFVGTILNLWFYKKQGISCLAKQLLAFQGQLHCVAIEWDTDYVNYR